MTIQLKQKPLFLLLLPVFFVLHGFAEHFFSLRLHEIIYLIGIYSIASITICWGFSFIFRDDNKSALMTSGLLAIYFFYGAIFDFLKTHTSTHGLQRYRILIPALIISLLVLFFFLKRTKRRLGNFVYFFNILMLIYIGIDLATIGWKVLDSGNKKSQNEYYSQTWKIPDTCAKPDIYFIIFDEYASSGALKDKFHYTNEIDSFLETRQFHVQYNSISNYNSTPFSIASILNMGYIKGIDSSGEVDREKNLNTISLIKENAVTHFLETNGYSIINLSIFDLGDKSTLFQQSFLPLNTKIITEGTLFERIYHDFDWIFFSNKALAAIFNKPAHPAILHRSNNNIIFQQVINQSTIKGATPRFIYAHFFMPHFPFFYDRFGNQRPDSIVLTEAMDNYPTNYVDYVIYVNSKIRQLVDSIQKNTQGSAVITLLGDHGFRNSGERSKDVFRNLNATYFPNRNYSRFYNSMSNVNYFRITFNTLFNQQFPQEKDSTSFLIIK